jgi:hypothetical protein
MGLRFAAIFLRRIMIIKIISTNATPAIMRIVVGSIESLSLNVLRHRPNDSLYRLLQKWTAGPETLEQKSGCELRQMKTK